MQKLLLVIPTLDQSGAEKQFSLLAAGLPREEFEIRAIALTRGGPYADRFHQQNIPLNILGKRFRFDPLCMFRLRKQIHEFQPDIIHSWLFAANSYTRLVAQAGQKNGVPKIVVSERCVDSWKSNWQLKLDKRFITNTSMLVGNSQPVVDFYRQLGYSETQVIPNGIELPKIDRSSRGDILNRLNIPHNAQVISFVGRLARQKRVKDLIWAFQLLRQLTGNVYFLIAGDGPERAKLEALSKHFECSEFIRFTGHQQITDDIFSVADVFWLASDYEGMSNSLMEAMAYELPVVVSDIPANRVLVTENETGYFVKPGDSVGFAQYANRLLSEKDLAQKMATAGRKRMESEFSVNQLIDRHVNLYRQLLK